MLIQCAGIANVERFYQFTPNHQFSATNALHKYLCIEGFESYIVGKAKCIAWKGIPQDVFILIVDYTITVFIFKSYITRRYSYIGRLGVRINIMQCLKITVAAIALVYGNWQAHSSYKFKLFSAYYLLCCTIGVFQQLVLIIGNINIKRMCK